MVWWGWSHRRAESVIEIASDLTRKSFRRLAAKVAYERWGHLRNSALLNDKQFERLRAFVLTGTETRPCCGIIADRKIIENFLKFPAGYHGVCIFAHPRNKVLGSFVSFYGLFYLWVILSTEFQALAALDQLLLEDPQNRKIYEPLLRGKTGNLIIHWEGITNPYLSDPGKVAFLALKYAYERFQQTANKFYDSKKLKHLLASTNKAD